MDETFSRRACGRAGQTVNAAEPEGLERSASGSGACRAGIAVAIVTSFLIVWTTVVRDDGTGIGFFLVIMAAGVGGFAVRFRPAGMARTMLGVAIMQLFYGGAMATAPVTASLPGGVFRAVLSGAVFGALWLVSATCFRAAAMRNPDGV
jgi:hypothetical protein